MSSLSESMGSATPEPGAGEGGSPNNDEPRRSGFSLARGRIFGSTSPVWIFLALVVIVLVFTIMKPHAFWTAVDIRNIFIQASLAMMLAVGMTFVIVTAGIDLSVGSVLVMSGVLAAKVMISVGGGVVHAGTAGWGPILAGCAIGLLVGLGWGIVNGVLVALLNIPPLIVTLGSFGMAYGLAEVITGGTDIAGIPVKFNNVIGSGKIGPIPWMVIVAAVVVLLFGFILHTTRFGRYTYAIGSNAEAVRRAGISVNMHLIKVYALAGLLSGLAGDLNLAYFNTTNLSGHQTDNLTAISAVVIGGSSLFGGSGTMFGTVVGVFIPVVLAAGLIIVGVPSFWQGVAIGAILVVAVYFDQLRRKARSRA